MLFKELAAHAQRASIAIMIIPEGDHLRVTITQKADKLKDGRLPLNITVAQTPEALDAELPAALAGFDGMAPSPAPILEQVQQQAAAAAAVAAEPTRKKVKAAKAEKTAAVKKPKKAAAEKKPPKPAKTPAAKPTKHIASKPTAEQCIAAYHAYVAAHQGEDIKREPFIKGNPTGRRFERLFGNWEKFVEAATKAGTMGPPGDGKTKPLPLEAPPQIDGKGQVTGIGYSVYRKNTGDLVGGIVREPDTVPKDGDIITMHDNSEWMVESVKDNRIIAYPWTPPADGKLPGLPASWPFPIPPAQIETAGEPASPATTTGRKVITAQGDVCIATGVELPVETDMEITVPGTSAKLRVLDFDDNTIWVEHVAQPSTEGAPA